MAELPKCHRCGKEMADHYQTCYWCDIRAGPNPYL